MNSKAQDLSSLNQRFGIDNAIQFAHGERDLTRMEIATDSAEAHVYLLGAHVTHYQSKQQPPMLLVSSKSQFEPGKPIRGGVPVIFPWFGAGIDEKRQPPHGPVRTMMWEVEKTDFAKGVATATLTTRWNDETRALWPHEFALRYTIAIGRQLELALEVENTSSNAFQFEEALHTYYAVSDVRQIRVLGLSKTDYLDKNREMRRFVDEDAARRIDQPHDRVYLDTVATCVIEDPGFERRIVIAKENSRSTIVWNPWGKELPDLAADDWKHFLCIETANVKANAVTLEAGKTHVMKAVIRSEPL